MKTLYILFFFLISCSAISQVPAFAVTVYDSSATEGYYFLSNGVYMMILDSTGNAVWYENGMRGFNFTLQPNGMMTYSNNNKFYFLDSTFTVVDSIACRNLYQTDAHDLKFLPNGHFLLLGVDSVEMDLSSYYWKGQFGSQNAHVRSGVIQEQDANRNVVFEWHAADHFLFDDADTFYLIHSSFIDWTHFNAVELDADGNILLSSRHFDEITKINRSDSSIIWRLGGNQNQFTFINSPVPFYGQHDIRRINNGHITFFDGGYNAVTHGARPLEFDLDETNKIATQTWSYTFDSAMYSGAQGSVQRLDNSNTVIDYGLTVNNNVGFVVVDSSGTKILEEDALASYRALNYKTLPWQLHRPHISCFDSSGTTYLDAGAGYNSYAWNKGDTTRIIPLAAVVDTYYVFVPYGQLGFISSEKFIVSDTSNLCGTVSVQENKLNSDFNINVFPDPVKDHLTVAYHLSKTCDVNISLFDISGRKIINFETETKQQGNYSSVFNISALDAGVYFVKLNNQVAKIIKN